MMSTSSSDRQKKIRLWPSGRQLHPCIAVPLQSGSIRTHLELARAASTDHAFGRPDPDVDGDQAIELAGSDLNVVDNLNSKI